MLETLIALIKNQLTNQFATGGMVIVVVTALLATMRHLPQQIWRLFLRCVITTVDIADHDPTFFWIQKWLSKHPYTQFRAKKLTATTRNAPQSSGGPKYADEEPVQVFFSPAPGPHLIRYNGSFILVNRVRKESDGTFGDMAYRETFTFSAFSRSTIQKLIVEARKQAEPIKADTITINRGMWSDWTELRQVPARPLESVILADNLMRDMTADIQQFLVDRDWYARMGIPYQRGYLFSGPPGNGKSSLALALASLVKMNLYLPNLKTSDTNFTSMLDLVANRGGILLFEDIDCLFTGRLKSQPNEDIVTFSGLLNALDGVCAANGRILIMTTNHPEVLDPALIRPGRVDRHFLIQNATKGQAETLFLRFFPEWTMLAKKFGQQVSHCDVSMAALQEHLLKYRNDVQAASDFDRRVDFRKSQSSLSLT